MKDVKQGRGRQDEDRMQQTENRKSGVEVDYTKTEGLRNAKKGKARAYKAKGSEGEEKIEERRRPLGRRKRKREVARLVLGVF